MSCIISMTSDHAGYILKSEIKHYLKNIGNYQVIDHGCDNQDDPVDYPDYAVKVVEDIRRKKSSYGILICGTGLGMSIAANRFTDIHAVVCHSCELAQLAREHSNANILCLGARMISQDLAISIVKQFLETNFSKDHRHQIRLDKLNHMHSIFNKKITSNEKEISKFTKMANEWWNENGTFKSLHMINPIRISYIIKKITEIKKCDLKNITLLDVGCGGGLLSESMARLGMHVSGIDTCKENIQIAQEHAQKVGLDIEYLHTSIEMLNDNKKYDIILLMEVVEHVDNVEFFIKRAISCLKQEGIIFLSTINRTIKSFLLAILGAEYILKWIPRGTHNWNKFLQPSEITQYFRENDVVIYNMAGIEYNILKNQWHITNNIDVNYILCGLLCSNP
ncbi:bifunctional 2-polyprenyl-6-hydroxyphenol methylase/3-demethylubiquinol 3-O-methyltransferase UbiG [Wolbachia endosymbiont of Howardula sp.]|uniref:bifunctional 2-polyprenyl-6-hydroxyphenol methylase/3-demethylubiquinol 3-O-methyltransferase UbiG n=1 Tax=Wolbachia endosymbiont of Howardula sp. TaxID=2916816 RepID=UPI00217E0D1E|nr:bifunctional 2-polyprenyl-6-hydroxyphenol methylase/3-demethylubiquinol 3-O-methyltransferase UbiG [Wolbachia endosymbiont of Howardula sp.]UWI83187.1 bifunctional 2-polyprenyl-6-hydroxyphenol methylase/3-demethylubiquinol 3-O-methyltransferase UbiG [Wolbachia endosymbiont of Howardula sp.]